MDSGQTFSRIYSAIIITLAVGLLIVMGIAGQFHWSTTLTFLAVACIISEWQAIRLPQGNSLTLSIIFILLALVFSFEESTTPMRQAVGALEIITISSLIGFGVTHRPPPLQLGFYIAHHIISTAAAGVAFVLLSDGLPYWFIDSFHIGGVIGYVVVVSLFSTLLVGPVNKRNLRGEKLPKADLLYTIFLAPIALIVYYFFDTRELDVISLIILALPLIGVLVTFTFYVNIDTTYGEINQLYRISKELVAAMSKEETVQKVSENIAQALSELILQVDTCLIYQHKPDANEYLLIHPNGNTTAPTSVLPGQGWLGRAARKSNGDLVADISQEDGLTPQEREWEPKTSVLLYPMDAEQERIGLLTLLRNGRAFTGEEHRLLGIVATQAGATLHNAQLYESSRQEAERDPQLKLLNQATFQVRAKSALARARLANQPVALLYGDIDDFRQVNNTYGHLTGDDVLVGFAQIWNEGAGPEGLACRWGGEELAILLPNTGEQEAFEIAEGIRSRIEHNPFKSREGQDIYVTISTGVAIFPRDAEEITELVKLADRAQYLAKRSGKNRVCVYEDRKNLIQETAPETAPVVASSLVQEQMP